MTVLYILGALAVLQGILSLRDGIRSARHIRQFRPRSPLRPRVAVCCPCKGLDPEFHSNIASIRDQDYPSFDAIFVVDSEDDPAYTELKTLGVTVLVAGSAVASGQKVHNLLHAIDHAPPDAEVFVFCDSDARYPPHWIRDLVAPLQMEGVAVSTGYRWYCPESGQWPALIRSIWNASVVTLLGAHERNFAWGGSMALRREIFGRIRVRDFWEGSVSDDYGVTRAARAARMRIVFTPTCLIPSYGGCGWRELLDFTTRQILITRIYDPSMWRAGFIAQTMYVVVFFGLFASMFTHGTAAFLWLAIFGLASAKAFVRLRAVENILSDGALSKQRWSYILIAPLIAALYVYNFCRSALTRQMIWRHIRYILISPNRTLVQRGGRAD